MRFGVLLLLLILGAPLPGLAGPSEPDPRLAITTSHERNPRVLLRQLPGLRHTFAMVRHELRALLGDDVPAERMLGPENERDAALRDLPPARRAHQAAIYPRAVALWAEFERLAAAVAGRPGEHPRLAYGDALAAFVADGPPPIPADADAVARDRIVLSMVMAGYGPKVIADVASGRLTIEMVEQAAKQRLLGRTDAEIARFLEAQSVVRAAVPSPRTGRERFDDVVVRLARQHGVDPDLVRAVITHESAWNSAARSHKGAIGLMQLMPETARLLRVDPVDPEQNIAGGVRYLADLGARFEGNLDAVLVAYVAGPTYAQRWLRGERVLDDEVRAYLDNVKTSYRRPGG